MANEFLAIDGVIIPANALALSRARALAGLLATGRLPYVKLVECQTTRQPDGNASDETVVLDVIVERPQQPVNDIRHTERLAVTFAASDRIAPEVVSLRPDFPWVPHVNLRTAEYPRSLCLYDRPWSEISSRWTPAVFVERIRHWLAATARGELHQDDQPLEPLLLHNGLRIVLPADIYKDLESNAPVRLDVCVPNRSKDCRTLFALRPGGPNDSPAGLRYIATTLVGSPQAHGLIRRSPASFAELHSFLVNGGIDLIGSLRERIRDWSEPKLLDARLAIIVALPLQRSSDGRIESWDFWVFATLATIREVGIDIGLWTAHGKEVGLLLSPDETRRGEATTIDILTPYREFSPTAAATANGISPSPLKVVAIGAGALGSQVITTLARSGFGDWTIVDEDDLLPHNLARHALHGGYVGHPKAVGMAHFLSELYEGYAKPITADVLFPGEQKEALQEAYSQAAVILDISASVTVARHVAVDVESPGRRVSVFLNPQGTDVVILAEDAKRGLTLDALEAQYYRAVNWDSALDGHLVANPGRLRYGRSCRDITTAMPTYSVTMHAALASEVVRTAIASENALIHVLRCQRDSLAIVRIRIEPAACYRQRIGDWTLVLDQRVLATLAELRSSKLPNETGGVLTGLYDLDRKTVYVVDTIPSPPDSAEWPTLYIRGSEGLLAQIERVTNRTGGQLEYVGEWHSHPDGCATLPSHDDLQVFGWLTEHLSIAGLPALMAIVGDHDASSWYLGEMLMTGGWAVS